MLDMPQPGAPAPDFQLPSTQGALRLSDVTAAGKVVLAFYQEDNTPLCSSAPTPSSTRRSSPPSALRSEDVTAYSDAVRDHFENPRNTGEIANADAVGYETNPVCGDTMRLTLRINGGRAAPSLLLPP